MPAVAPPVHTPPPPPTPSAGKRQKLNTQVALPRANSGTLVTAMEGCFVTSNGVVVSKADQGTFMTSSGVVVSNPNEASFKTPKAQLVAVSHTPIQTSVSLPPVQSTVQPLNHPAPWELVRVPGGTPAQPRQSVTPQPVTQSAQSDSSNTVRYYVVVNHGGARYFHNFQFGAVRDPKTPLAPYLTVIPTIGGCYKTNNCVYVKSLENQKWLEIENNGNQMVVETNIRGSKVFQVITPRGCTFRSRPDMQSKVADLSPAVVGNVYFAIRATENWVQIREGLWLPIRVPTPNGHVDILRECISYNLHTSSTRHSPVAAPVCAGSPPSVSISTPRKGNCMAVQRPTPSLFNNTQWTRSGRNNRFN